MSDRSLMCVTHFSDLATHADRGAVAPRCARHLRNLRNLRITRYGFLTSVSESFVGGTANESRYFASTSAGAPASNLSSHSDGR
jgi:hypothetical protein